MFSGKHKNVINTLIARDDMSSAQIKQHLFDVAFKATLENSASITKHDEPSVKPSQYPTTFEK